jgi:hypothetical protein
MTFISLRALLTVARGFSSALIIHGCVLFGLTSTKAICHLLGHTFGVATLHILGH